MAQSKIVLAPIVACPLLLVMGALNQQPRQASAAVNTPFVSEPSAAPSALSRQAPQEILARAVATLEPQRLSWLIVKTWQKQVDDEISFEADGRLVLGPNHCARLDMNIHGTTGSNSVVIVSDGVGVARACRSANKRAEVTSQRFLSPAKTPLTGPQIDQVLSNHGCGGPYRLLNDLAGKLDNIQMEMGVWQRKSVVRLTGFLKAAKLKESGLTVEPRLCRIYLDAHTLWPHRVEWWASRQPNDAEFLFLQVEYREPQINQPLSHEDCVREFTYVPE
jgi:hypothetical protein